VALRDLFRSRPRTPAQQRAHVRVLVFAGTLVGILVVVIAAVAVFTVFLGRFGA
jgi:hypothetical protein